MLLIDRSFALLGGGRSSRQNGYAALIHGEVNEIGGASYHVQYLLAYDDNNFDPATPQVSNDVSFDPIG